MTEQEFKSTVMELINRSNLQDKIDRVVHSGALSIPDLDMCDAKATARAILLESAYNISHPNKNFISNVNNIVSVI